MKKIISFIAVIALVSLAGLSFVYAQPTTSGSFQSGRPCPWTAQEYPQYRQPYRSHQWNNSNRSGWGMGPGMNRHKGRMHSDRRHSGWGMGSPYGPQRR